MPSTTLREIGTRTTRLLAVVALAGGVVVAAGPDLPSAAAAPPSVTVGVFDVNAGPARGNPSGLIGWAGGLYFSAQDGFACSGSGPEYGEEVGDALGEYGRELFTIDSSGLGRVVADLNDSASGNCSGVAPAFDGEAAATNGALLFNGRNNPFSSDATRNELYGTGGGPETTALVRDIYRGGVSYQSSDPSGMTALNDGNRVVFGARDAFGGYEPWISDGTEDGTHQVVNLTDGDYDSDVGPFEPLGSGFVFVAEDDDITIGPELYYSSGSGATLLADINPGNYDGGDIEHLTEFPSVGLVAFAADNDVDGVELWLTDGSSAGTRMLDLNPGPGSSEPRGFIEMGGLLYFSADDGEHGHELWVTDGTAGGTRMVVDARPGPDHGYFPGDASNSAVFDGRLFYVVGGPELWVTDGTAEGTANAGLLSPGEIATGLRELTVVRDLLYFTGNASQVWVSDGSSAGTLAVFDEPSSSPSDLTAAGSMLGFIATTGTHGEEVFFAKAATDGVGPPAPALNVTPNPAEQFESIEFLASATDASTGGSDIVGLEFQVDGGDWAAMEPLDGSFDSVNETGVAELSFEDAGTHDLCARGIDAAANRGPSNCTDVEIEPVGAIPLALTITSIRPLDPSAPVGKIFVSSYVQGISDVNYAQAQPIPDDGDRIEPFWAVGGAVSSAPTMPVSFGVFHDPGLGPQQLDADPDADDMDVVLAVDEITGKWSGDVEWPRSCVAGTGEFAVEVCFDISTQSATGDLDGDGLLDSWERYGFDANSDGTIDLPLPEWGANVDHKDLFWEIDHMPGRAYRYADLEPIRKAFAAAPVDAGGIENPDGRPGIDLHLDVVLEDAADLVGGYDDSRYEATDPIDMCHDGINNDVEEEERYGTDPLVDLDDGSCTDAGRAVGGLVNSQGLGRESWTTPWPCDDGIDNDGDDLADEVDPDCHVLESSQFGGAAEIPDEKITGVGDDAFADRRAADFDPNRRWVFRYQISASTYEDNRKGGQANLPGSNGILYQRDPGSIMHEFGHNLFLRHGGFEHVNRKSNYISVMNYDLQSGIPLGGDWAGTGLIDFSPPRYPPDREPTERGTIPLPTLVESALDDGMVLDSDDPVHRSVIGWGTGCEDHERVQIGLDQSIDWDLDGVMSPTPIANPRLNQPPYIDKDDGECKDEPSAQRLDGHDDWSAIVLPNHASGGAANAEGPPVEERELTTEELEAERRAINSTDLSVTATLVPDPPVAAQPAELVIEVTNNGPNPADGAFVTAVVPAGAIVTGGNCDLGPEVDPSFDPDTVYCAAVLDVGETVTRTVRLVFAEGPASIPVEVRHPRGADTGDVRDEEMMVQTVVAPASATPDPVTPSPAPPDPVTPAPAAPDPATPSDPGTAPTTAPSATPAVVNPRFTG